MSSTIVTPVVATTAATATTAGKSASSKKSTEMKFTPIEAVDKYTTFFNKAGQFWENAATAIYDYPEEITKGTIVELMKTAFFNTFINGNTNSLLADESAKKAAKVKKPGHFAPTNFLLFFKENLESIRTANPGVSQPEAAKILSDKWKVMTEEEKMPFTLKHEEIKRQIKEGTYEAPAKKDRKRKASVSVAAVLNTESEEAAAEASAEESENEHVEEAPVEVEEPKAKKAATVAATTATTSVKKAKK
jgi:hypothetical protein